MDDRFTHHERASSSRHASRYDILQPQFKQPTRLVPPRDRYRVTRYDDPMYDTVEDDRANDIGSQLDSFDDRLLRQPYLAHHQQNMQHKGKLSFAPAHLQASYGARGIHHNQGEHRSHAEQDTDSSLSRFAYHPVQSQESSSDPHTGRSSSPAFKASQRRTDQTTAATSQCGSRVRPFEGARQQTIEFDEYDHRQPCRQTTSPDFQRNIPDQQLALTQRRDRKPPCPRYQTHLGAETDLMASPNAPPVCQGIRLVPVATLPDRLQTVFPYPTFNAVQSKCFDKVFRSDNNFVLASPTGSGKTVILELAVCRAFATNSTGQYKIVYQAPTKALCSERQRDWEAKFSKIGLKCAVLTGDSDASDLRHVQSANIIITTPEKWDSMTRKWRDHEKLMRLIRVFLIDEVHILKEDRGATLEAVVSRMKSIGTDVRFVALSATVPNFNDIATWLGKSSTDPDSPATNEKFGEEFRPVKLRKHVCGYASNTNNEFGFEKVLDTKIKDVIATYSEGKPIMVFCATRNSTLSTARLIASWWASSPGNDRFWTAPSKPTRLHNKDLQGTVASGVAFHHAGLDIDDRMQIERSFIAGDISVICCTSTLAVGVNLPCHLVIVKNTVAWGPEGHQEYSDLEMMQMLGRAGRPQFDNTAVAVIMTRQAKVRRYELMVTGQDTIESKLHLNLVDHMNAEIGLGTIRDLPSARKWLKGTFLFVRLQQNPEYYKLQGARDDQSIQEKIDDICFRDVNLLRQSNLISGDEHFTCTEFGHAMSRYYIHFETMKLFMGLEPKSSPSEILSAIAQAKEYSTIRFRQGEKSLYKIVNKSPSIRWTIPVNLDLPAQKISLIIQSVLGSADISWDGEMAKHRSQYTTETMMIFKNIGNLIRCIIDCQIVLGDAVSIHSALMLERSFGARAWDDSPLQMKQIESLGVVAVRKLVNAGIKSIDDLEGCDPQRIEALLGRNPPYGLQILEKIKCFPKLRVSLQAQPSTIMRTSEGVKIQIKADIGFINERPPLRFNNKLIYVCLLVETSDGRKAHFARISDSKLGTGQAVVVPVILTRPDQFINCHVMCDGIAGSMRSAMARPHISPSIYSSPRPSVLDAPISHQSNMSKRRTENAKASRKSTVASDDFGDDGLDDDTLVKAACGDLKFDHIEAYPDPLAPTTHGYNAKIKSHKGKETGQSKIVKGLPETLIKESTNNATRLPNGKWACNHPCKDREACKHFCCKNGMDKPPKKKPVTRSAWSGEPQLQPQQKVSPLKGKETQTKLQLVASKRKAPSQIEELDLTRQEKKQKEDHVTNDSREHHELQNKVKVNVVRSATGSVIDTKPSYCYSPDADSNSFMDPSVVATPPVSSDYGNIQFDETLDYLDLPQQHDALSDLYDAELECGDFIGCEPTVLDASPRSEKFDDDDDPLLGDAMIGLADSHMLQDDNEDETDTMHTMKSAPRWTDKENFQEAQHRTDDEFADINSDMHAGLLRNTSSRTLRQSQIATVEGSCPIFEDCKSESKVEGVHLEAVKVALDNKSENPNSSKTNTKLTRTDKGEYESTIEGGTQTQWATSEKAASVASSGKSAPGAFTGLEPWLFQEFGDIVELIDE